MAKELKKAELIAAHDEINTEIGIDPEVDSSLALDEYEKELAHSIYDLELEDEEIEALSDETQKVISKLNKKYEGVFDDDSDEDEPEADEDEEDEIPEPPVKKGKKAEKPAPIPEEDDEDEDEDEAPAPPPAKKGKKIAKVPEPEEDEDEDDEEEDKPVLKKGKADKKSKEKPDKKAKKVKVPEPDDDDDDEEDEPVVKKGKKEKEKPAAKKAKREKAPALEWPKGMAYGDTVTFEDRSKNKLTGTLKKYFWHKQSQKFWFIIDVKGKDYYKHAPDVSKVKRTK